ncbi:MAG: hypothetical protein JW809_04605 [Pirellulales bacterium]|nr:hypothetical protein [Pirellulales bacterium]
MRQLALLTVALAAMVLPGTALGAYEVTYDFEAAWAGDYHPDWQNSDYRHGEPPVGKMMQQVDLSAYGRSGNGLKLIADSAPQDWMWWAIVEVKESTILPGALNKVYNPYLQVDYYDPGPATSPDPQATGQLYALPSWVNPYIDGSEDWTDVQFGARFNQYGDAADYYYVAAGEGSPGWVTTGVDRTVGWHTLKMQLLDADGKIHFFIDGVEVGQSYRDDYIDLGGVSLATMFTAPLSGWGDDKPYTIWDNYTFGSEAPEPASLVIWSLLAGLGVALTWRRRSA